jgi:hypothetical protein
MAKRKRKSALRMKGGIDLRRTDHTVCKVAFEDAYGNMKRAIIRIPRKVTVTSRNVVNLVENKTRNRVGHIVEQVCTTARLSNSHRLPRSR